MVTFSQLGNFGRAGNQFWQIASTIGIAVRNNKPYCFPEWKYQKYFKNELPEKILNIRTAIVKEKNFHYDDYILSGNLDYDLHGYFQSLRYWEHCKEEVLNYFEFKDQLKENIRIWSPYANISEWTSIHVRRGDYLNLSDYHTNLSIDYYLEAIKLFPKSLFFVCSDDIEWCKTQFPKFGFYFSEANSEVQDLYLMSICDNNIIANSSFSFWGAYLNKNPNKTVIAPKNWFGSKMAHVSTKDLIPSDWIQI